MFPERGAGRDPDRWRVGGPRCRPRLAVGALVTAMPTVSAPNSPDAAYDLLTDALHVLVDAASRHHCVPASTWATAARPPSEARAGDRGLLAALTAADGRFDTDDDGLGALERALRPWAEIGTGRVGPARATFRLSEVEPRPSFGEASDESASWRLEFLLQSTQDPSLLVPAAQVWSDDGSLRRWLDRPHELLLGELGRASRIYSELAAGLRRPRLRARSRRRTAPQFLAIVARRWTRPASASCCSRGGPPRPARSQGHREHADDGVVAGSHFGREALMDFRWQWTWGRHVTTTNRRTSRDEAPLVGCAGNGLRRHGSAAAWPGVLQRDR